MSSFDGEESDASGEHVWRHRSTPSLVSCLYLPDTTVDSRRYSAPVRDDTERTRDLALAPSAATTTSQAAASVLAGLRIVHTASLRDTSVTERLR